MPRMLIADDEKDICTLIKRYAEREGFEVVAVADGSEVVEMCKKENFDIIIMDVMMPDTDGFTACRKIRELKDIPVLMLSARGTEYDKLFGFEVGVDDYVTKPFSPKELMARVSGLGLAIVKQITELHKGTCYANSEKCKGSTFTMELSL